MLVENLGSSSIEFEWRLDTEETSDGKFERDKERDSDESEEEEEDFFSVFSTQDIEEEEEEAENDECLDNPLIVDDWLSCSL